MKNNFKAQPHVVC